MKWNNEKKQAIEERLHQIWDGIVQQFNDEQHRIGEKLIEEGVSKGSTEKFLEGRYRAFSDWAELEHKNFSYRTFPFSQN